MWHTFLPWKLVRFIVCLIRFLQATKAERIAEIAVANARAAFVGSLLAETWRSCTRFVAGTLVCTGSVTFEHVNW